MRELRRRFFLSFVALACVFQTAGCTSNENAHTTATTIVPPPPRQVLKVVPVGFTLTREGVENKPCGPSSLKRVAEPQGADLTKPLLVDLGEGETFRIGQDVVIDFTVCNAKLRSDGGDFRVRYIIDDDDPQWVENAYPFGLSGWVAGKHTIRLELIGPDGWPYKNGNQNIITREITVTDQ